MDVYWRRSSERRQWELIRDDKVRTPERISYVTDEFLANAALPDATMRTLLDRRFPVPLPDEAFAGG